jgi:hypothetical protein
VIYPVRYVQRLAQRAKELVVFQVYMQMMHLYFGLLDQRNSLVLYDPALTITLQEKGVHVTDNGNTADRLQPTSQLLPKDIDPRTQAGREKLKEAMYKRYYKQYHMPIVQTASDLTAARERGQCRW